jgi:arginyl-tRNA synthetase
VGLVLARRTGRPAGALAATIARWLDDGGGGWLGPVEVGGPGFLNVRFTVAFWRALFADALAAGPAWGRSAAGTGRRSEVVLLAGAGETSPRALAVADATANVLAARGYTVARATEAASAERAAEPWRVAVRGTGACDAVVCIGPVRGEPPFDRAPAAAARFFFLRRAPALPLELDPRPIARHDIESPLVAIGYALDRAARLGPPPAAADFAALDDAALPVLRAAVELPEAVEASARVAPHVLAGFAVELAAAFHRYYNRVAAVNDDLEPTAARRALAGGVAQALRTALGLLGVDIPAGS